MIDQNTLFAEEEKVKKRTRKQETYRRSSSKDGSLSIKFEPDLAAEVRDWCWLTNQNCNKFAVKWIKKGLEEEEASMFQTKDRDGLIDMIKRLRSQQKTGGQKNG